ncbi:MAG: hypothetical protein KC609_05720 [Myxococcales bacterium]|nr:hypothetical protein [Myxococcales bacterium]
MRIVTLVLAFLFLGLGSFFSFIRYPVNGKHADQLSRQVQRADKLIKVLPESHPKRVKAKAMIDAERGKPGRLKTASFLLLLSGVLALGLLVLTLMKKSSLITVGAIGLLAMTAAVYVVAPEYKVGLLAAAPLRAASMIVFTAYLLGGLAAFGSDRLRLRKERKSQLVEAAI